MAHWNRLFTCLPIHSMVIFHCYVSLPEGTSNPSDLSASLLFDASTRGANPPCSDTPMTHVCNYRFPVKLRGAGNKSIYAEYDSDESLILPGHQKSAVLQSISFKNMIQNLSTVLDGKIFPSFPVHKCRTLMRIGMKSVVAGLPRRPCLPNAAETMTYICVRIHLQTQRGCVGSTHFLQKYPTLLCHWPYSQTDICWKTQLVCGDDEKKEETTRTGTRR